MTDDRTLRRAGWAAAAPGWLRAADDLARQTAPVSMWMVDAVAPQPGHAILELAAGTGDTGFLAAELAQPGGTLWCTDWSPEMLSAAQERARRVGVSGVRFKQVDLEQPLDFPAASLDGVLCRWGLMLISDPEAALREIRRVLRPGGRLALAAWAEPAANPWMTTAGIELRRRGLLAPVSTEEPGPFAWSPDGRIAAALSAAGFVEWDVRPLAFEQRHPDFDDFWRGAIGCSISLRAALASADEQTAGAARDAARAAAERFQAPDGSLVLPAKTWVAVASA
jgi:SAM-dependent methyltransferase